VIQAGIRALALAAAIFFPALLLAIWWRRCSRLGAMLALGFGFAAMASEMAFGGVAIAGQFRFTVVAAALIGVALGLIAGVVGSLLGPKPSPAAQAISVCEPDRHCSTASAAGAPPRPRQPVDFSPQRRNHARSLHHERGQRPAAAA
jgi:Na+/proline symporter